MLANCTYGKSKNNIKALKNFLLLSLFSSTIEATQFDISEQKDTLKLSLSSREGRESNSYSWGFYLHKLFGFKGLMEGIVHQSPSTITKSRKTNCHRTKFKEKGRNLIEKIKFFNKDIQNCFLEEKGFTSTDKRFVLNQDTEYPDFLRGLSIFDSKKQLYYLKEESIGKKGKKIHYFDPQADTPYWEKAGKWYVLVPYMFGYYKECHETRKSLEKKLKSLFQERIINYPSPSYKIYPQGGKGFVIKKIEGFVFQRTLKIIEASNIYKVHQFLLKQEGNPYLSYLYEGETNSKFMGLGLTALIVGAQIIGVMQDLEIKDIHSESKVGSISGKPLYQGPDFSIEKSKENLLDLSLSIALMSFNPQLLPFFFLIKSSEFLSVKAEDVKESKLNPYCLNNNYYDFYKYTDSCDRFEADCVDEIAQNSEHPLTHEFWKGRGLSNRLKNLTRDVEKLKEEIINYRMSTPEFIRENLKKYKDIFISNEAEPTLPLIGANLHLMSENSVPQNLDYTYAPAVIQLENRTYHLIVNGPNGIKRIPPPKGIDLNELGNLFKNNSAQKKLFLGWNSPIMKYITSEGGHNHLIPVDNGQFIKFTLQNARGGTGNDLIILSHDKTNLIAIKRFNKIEEGLEELFHSLMALDINPSPQEFKMVGIYDAVLYPENSLNIIMEGANTHVIYHFLPTVLGEGVVKACAEYFSKFHINNYYKIQKNIDRKKYRNMEQRYIDHMKQIIKKTKCDPLKEGKKENPHFCTVPGSQSANSGRVKAHNITRLLTRKEQENLNYLVEKVVYPNLEKNFIKQFSLTNHSDFESQLPYFLTITHGDAHGDNIFYNDDESLKLDNHEISKDSSYRITMIDAGSTIRTYGYIGDPAEDVGRFLASLWDWFSKWDWFSQKNYTEPKRISKRTKSKTIENFEKKFLDLYLGNIKNSKIIKENEFDEFSKIFMENCNFHKLHCYRAFFNSKRDDNEKRDNEIKIKILKSWMKQNEALSLPPRDSLDPYKARSPHRFWEPINGTTVALWLPPDQPAEFIESVPEGTDKSYLTLLWERLHSTGTVTLSSKAAIAGMGGIGKTTLALAYAHEALANNAYSLIYWLLSETPSSLLKGYTDLLLDLGVSIEGQDSNDIIELVKQHVSSRKGKVLLIYDNVPNSKFLENKVPEENAHILITSRWHNGWNQQIDLGVFRPEESIKYLLNITGSEANEDSTRLAKGLSRELGNFPLALSLAGHYIKIVGKENVSKAMEEYLNKLTNAPDFPDFEQCKSPFKDDEVNYENLVNRTIAISKGYISDLAKEFMVYSSYLSPDSIAKDIFLGSMEKEDVDQAFDELSSLSLIKPSQHFFSMHQLVQLVVRQEQENEQNRARLPQHIRSLLTNFRQYWQKLNDVLNKEDLLPTDQLYLPIFTVPPHLRNFYGHLNEFLKNKKFDNDQIIDFKVATLSLEHLFEKDITSLRSEILKRIQQDKPDDQQEVPLEILLQEELKKAQLELSKKELESMISILPSDPEDLAAILQSFKEIVPDQRQEIIECSKILIKKNMNGNDRLEIIKTLSNLVHNQRQEITEYTNILISVNDTGWGVKQIIKALSKISLTERQNIVEHSRNLINAGMGGRDIKEIIEILDKTPDDQRQKFTKCIKDLIEIVLSMVPLDQCIAKTSSLSLAPCRSTLMNDEAYVRLRVIKALSKVEFDQYLTFTERVRDLISNDMGSHSRMRVVEALSEVECSQYEIFIESSKNLRKNLDGYSQMLLIEAISALNPTQYQEVIEGTRQLITDNIDGESLWWVIRALSHIEPNQYQEVIPYVKNLFNINTKGEDIGQIIYLISQVDPDQRQIISESTEKLMNVDGLIYRIIVALSEVSPEQRHVIAEHAKNLISTGMNGGDVEQIIRSLRKINFGQYQEITKYVKKLITDDTVGYTRARIIEALSEIAHEQREEITKYANELKGAGRLNMDVIVKSFSEVAPDQRCKISAHLKNIVTDEMDGWNVAKIIRTLYKKISVDQYEDFVESIKNAISDDMDGDTQAEFISIFGEATHNQCKILSQYTKELIDKDMGGSNQLTIIDAISKITLPHCQLITEYIKELKSYSMHWYGRVRLIQILSEVDPEQCAEIIKYTKKFMTNDPNKDEPDAIIDAIKALPLNQYQKLTDKILFLLKLSQENDTISPTSQNQWLKDIITPTIQITKTHELIPIFKDIYATTERH